MNEPMRGVNWMVATLKNDSAVTGALPGGIWLGVAPPKQQTYPLATIQAQGGRDVMGSNQTRLWLDADFVLKIYGPATNPQALETAADAIDAALEKQSGTSADGGVIMTSIRQQAYILSELVNGELYFALHSVYRLLIHS